MRILHAADLHLDSVFTALPVEKARQRRRESRDLLDKLASLTVEENIDLVLLPGDLFDGDRVYPETIARLKTALENMNCPVFIAPGNHDPCIRFSPYVRETWPDNVHIFTSQEVTSVELGALNCVVHGAAFLDRHRFSEPLEGYAAPKDDRLHVLCLHGAVDEPGSSYGNIRREQIRESGFDYLALGHVHQYSGEQLCGGSIWAYSGCPEGRGFDETGDKGVVIADVWKGHASLRFFPLNHRCYRVLKTDVTNCTAAEAMERVIPKTAERDICRIVFTGETGEEGIDLHALETDWAPRFYELQLRDETIPTEDIWQRAGENSLKGLFLRDLRTRYEAATSQQERNLIISAVRFGLAAMDGRDLG